MRPSGPCGPSTRSPCHRPQPRHQTELGTCMTVIAGGLQSADPAAGWGPWLVISRVTGGDSANSHACMHQNMRQRVQLCGYAHAHAGPPDDGLERIGDQLRRPASRHGPVQHVLSGLGHPEVPLGHVQAQPARHLMQQPRGQRAHQPPPRAVRDVLLPVPLRNLNQRQVMEESIDRALGNMPDLRFRAHSNGTVHAGT